jgi:hypothetical protein
MRGTGLLALLLCLPPLRAGEAAISLRNSGVRVELDPATLEVAVTDPATGVRWELGSPHVVLTDGRKVAVRRTGEITRSGSKVTYATSAGLEFTIGLAPDAPAVEYGFRGSLQPFGAPEMDEVQLIHQGLATGPGEGNQYAVPARMGIQLRPEGAEPFARRLAAYQTVNGYSMAMMGAVRSGSAVLVSWDTPYTDLLVHYSGQPDLTLHCGLAMRGTARKARIQPLGRGGYVEIAKAYRAVAESRGLVETMAEKLRRNPKMERLNGAAGIKLFTLYHWAPHTPYSSSDEERIELRYTFEEVGALAEHLKQDLGIERALVVLAGWMTEGYDGRHPDVLPAAPEPGGNEGLAALSQRVRGLGYLFGLHDNYTDFYRHAPSWDEDYIRRGQDGSLMPGGVWAGGQAYLICPRKGLELAARPANIPGVLDLFSPDVYFIDVVAATDPRTCFDPRHPVKKADDLRLKAELCDSVRGKGLVFGSEEGKEWAVPRADYFEGILGHKTRSHAAGGDTVIPLFELVFGDAIPMFTHQSERLGPDNPAQLLDHILYAEMPLYKLGTHRYWTDPALDYQPPPGAESRMVFARGGPWGLYDRFLKNTYEVLSPLSRITAGLPMTGHRFETADRSVESTTFGNEVEITVNYGQGDFSTGDAVLPQWGFLVRSPRLVAFYARRYGRISYEEPVLFVIRPLDGRALGDSDSVSVFHPFGDPRLDFRGRIAEIRGVQQVVGKAKS